jgi:hypothetical protein
MFTTSVKNDYMGNDAMGEIIIMLLVAFIFGWIARWLWDLFFEYEVKEEYFIEDVPTAVPDIITKPDIIVEKEKVSPNGLRHDNLKVVEGIGPKIEGLLKKTGINTWEDLSKSNPESLKNILKDAGDRFTFHDPSTWSEQAALANQDKWNELEEFQDFLSGGRKK